MSVTADADYIEEPRLARLLFASKRTAWIWLIVRVWLGWQWLSAGWGKVFGGNITWKFWDWGNKNYSFFGKSNIGWVRSGTVTTSKGSQYEHVGDSVVGFAKSAIANSTGPHATVAYGWYADFLKWVEKTGYHVIGPVVAVAEVVVGVALIIGAFVGIAACVGATLNFTYAFAGSAGVNPPMILIAGLLILAWRSAGWLGLDRKLLPLLGTPWQRGTAFRHDAATATSRAASPEGPPS